MPLPEVLARIEAAARRAGRDPASVRLVAVTKGRDLAEIERKVLRYGDFPLGENRIQEARAKIAAWPEREWHFIGPLQRNKVRYLRPFRLVHSVDSLRLAEALAARAKREGYRPRILLEVNVAREPQKHGFDPDEVDAAVQAVRQLEPLELRGLMTMAPLAEDPEEVRWVFRELARMARHLGLPELSMGMSGDFEVAVEEGATLVRVGRALFEG
ncbi:YggS family pyridoxal phosphate-dependent enzyme [Oceanithermus profundus]|uniref:Pyridoxal phosphate homeostasis protein n=1 Tax=Oceanithermus profundus (strain DSM 14977 / NBRC 100410 / VKM B-2274 / 506) TaxID=670487 RepID=E4U879_OCEP5|nr:YggS family pyridoxal phosphate-dependent enzyme [Oceanithermus profundus]ADR36294.1 alanine racemase domain protein [Oceanithermus profundus DSM 14977]